MGSRKKRSKSFALFVIAIMVMAVVAGAFTYFQFLLPPPDCGEPTNPTPLLSGPFTVTHNNLQFNARNTTFSGPNQIVVIGNDPNTITFQTTVYSDPSKPHLVGGECVTDPSAPVTLLLKVRFQTDSQTEDLQLQYGGNPLRTPEPAFTTHTNPQAGVRWTPYDNHVTLLARFN